MPANREAALGSVETERCRYDLHERIARGVNTSTYFAAASDGSKVVIKVAQQTTFNTLLLNELSVLAALSEPLIPKVIDSFRLTDQRLGLVFPWVDGVDLVAIRSSERHCKGVVEHFHLGWLIEHQLGLVAKLHAAQVVHGGINSRHVLVTPSNHEVRFIDFSYATLKPHGRCTVETWTDGYSAPEIKEGVPPLPGMDIYSIGKVAVFLAGGDPITGEIPKTIGLDPSVHSFIARMIEPDYLKRPRDARKLAQEFLALRRTVYGPARRVDFQI